MAINKDNSGVYDVVFVGGGVAAVGCARRLLDAGLTVRMIDKGSMERDPEKPHDLANGIMGAGTFSDGKYSFFPAGTKIWELNDKASILRCLRAGIDELNAAHQATYNTTKQDNYDDDGGVAIPPAYLAALLGCIALAFQGARHGFESTAIISYACAYTILTVFVWVYELGNRALQLSYVEAALMVSVAIFHEFWLPNDGLVLVVAGTFAWKMLLLVFGPSPSPSSSHPPPLPLLDTATLMGQVEEHFRALEQHRTEPSVLSDTADEEWKFKAYTSVYVPLTARLKLVRDASELMAPHALMEHVVHNITRSDVDGIYEVAYQVGGCSRRISADAH